MNKKELQVKVMELERENGELARRIVGIELHAERLEMELKQKRTKEESLWGDLQRARAERDQEKEKCKTCGLYKLVDDLKEEVGLQKVTLERWRKFEKLLREAGWALEFD